MTYIGLGQPGLYFPRLSKIAGGLSATILLSHIINLSDHRSGNWVYQVQASLVESTGLTIHEVNEAKTNLIALGLVDERIMGSPPTKHLRVDFGIVQELLGAAMAVESVDDPIQPPEYQDSAQERVLRAPATPVLVDDEAVKRLQAQFGNILGGPDAVKRHIEEALAHEAAKRWTNKIIYVRRWLQREVDARSKPRGMAQGNRNARPGPSQGVPPESGRYSNWGSQ